MDRISDASGLSALRLVQRVLDRVADPINATKQLSHGVLCSFLAFIAYIELYRQDPAEKTRPPFRVSITNRQDAQ